MKLMLLGLGLMVSSQQISAQGLLGIGATSLTGLPDTARYGDTIRDMKVWIVNRGVLPLTGVLVEILASPNQDAPIPLGILDLTQGLLLNPGDSVQVPMDDYTVSPQNSSGGSNVIVIWPTAPGTQPEDSAGGSYWVEEIVGVASAMSSSPSILVYPNPGNGTFRLQHSLGTLSEGTAQIYHSSGQPIAQREIGPAGVLDLNDLSEGFYLYRIILNGRHGTTADTGKLMIQRN